MEGLVSQSTLNNSLNVGSQMSLMSQSGYDPALTSKSPVKPFYIIHPESSALSAFRVITGLLSMPSVALYLFLIAFGFN